MSKKILTFVTLLAFTHSIMTCAPVPKKTSKDRVTSTTKITSAVLPSGKVIKFDKDSGRMFVGPAIEGVTVNGEKVSIPLNDIMELRTSIPNTIPAREISNHKIEEVILNGGIRIRFKDNKIEYNEKEGRLRGRVITNSQILNRRSRLEKKRGIRLSDIQKIRVGEPETITRNDLLSDYSQRIAEIVKKDDSVVTFDANGGSSVTKTSVLKGIVRGRPFEINPDEVLYVKIKQTDPGEAFVRAIGVLALGFLALGLIVAATKESCPFVYSYDGEKYIFDAEPLGGAIAKGLSRTDYSRLEHLKPVNEKYHLIMRNEVEEIQFIDETKLVVVDHSSGTEIAPDLLGNLIQIRKPLTAVSAKDKKGMNLMNFVKARDEIVWQTHLPTSKNFDSQNLRHELTFEFPKPEGARRAKLIVNAGTALWGSNMIREMLQLRGNAVDNWYQGVNSHGPEFEELYDFVEREELYLLKLYVKEGTSWKQRASIPGAGPLITEDKVLYLDLRKALGDKLTIRLNPPMGFWTLDYLAVEYEYAPNPQFQEIPIAQATDHLDQDVTQTMTKIDSSYYIMPEVGDWAKLSFNAPPPKEGMNRTVFLKTSGYYEIQFPKDKPEQTKLIQQLLTTDGMIVEYAMEEYIKWRAQQLSMK